MCPAAVRVTIAEARDTPERTCGSCERPISYGSRPLISTQSVGADASALPFNQITDGAGRTAKASSELNLGRQFPPAFPQRLDRASLNDSGKTELLSASGAEVISADQCKARNASGVATASHGGDELTL